MYSPYSYVYNSQYSFITAEIIDKELLNDRIFILHSRNIFLNEKIL